MLTFNGQDNFLNVPDLVAGTATGISVFGVARQTGTGNDTWGCVILGQANSTAWTGGGYGLTALNSGNTSFGFWVRDYATNFVANATTLSAPTLMSGIWNGTTANSVQYFQDGTTEGTDAYTPGSVGDNGSTYIGAGLGSGTQYCFYGDIAEVIVYNTGLSATNVNKVNSYLALKYGITLSTSYVNTSGTTIFTTAAPYNNNIIGIGREDNNLLNQKQSHNYDDSVRVYISSLAASNSANAGSFANNVSYVIMGANTGKLAGIAMEKPGSVFSRLSREWLVTNTNFSSTFNMDIKLSSAAALGSVNISDLRLLVDDDGDFSNAITYAAGGGLSFSYSSPVITVTGIGNTHIASGATRYITIASAAGTTPLPVELLRFEALECNGMVCLDWETASEKNNEHFDIERSANGETWETVTSVKGAGNSLIKHVYSGLDHSPLPGISYYQLHQYDLDHKSSYSPVVSIDMRSKTELLLKVYPNPSNTFILIEGAGNEPGGISMVNSLGENLNVDLSSVGNGLYKMETLSLPEGIYYLQLINPTANNIHKEGVKLIIRH